MNNNYLLSKILHRDGGAGEAASQPHAPLPHPDTLTSARELLNQRKADFKLPSNFNSEEFRMVAIGSSFSG